MDYLDSIGQDSKAVQLQMRTILQEKRKGNWKKVVKRHQLPVAR